MIIDITHICAECRNNYADESFISKYGNQNKICDKCSWVNGGMDQFELKETPEQEKTRVLKKEI